MKDRYTPVVGWLVVAIGLIAVGGCGGSSSAPPSAATATATPTATFTPTPSAQASGLFLYWDQNEEEDTLTPSGHLAQLIPVWDANGQLCLFPPGFGPSGGGGFVTGYNPTVPSQHNLGGLKPMKNPPVGEAVWDRNGNFTGQTIFVPGPYALPPSTVGGDIPPDLSSKYCTNGTQSCQTDADCPSGGTCTGTYNNNGTFTGCAFDSRGDLFAADIGQAQGSMASPDQGRIIEWFPPDYASFCIIIGPTQDGDAAGMHHVNGTGGLRNPGFMAVDPDDNLYVPESGSARVLKFDHAGLPHSAAACGPDGLLAPPAPFQVFIPTGFGIPAGIARDPTCSTDTSNCWAVTNIISASLGGNAVSWFDDSGHLTKVKGPIPKGGFSPFGIAVTPGGDVFFVDVGLSCDASGCGSIDNGGGIFKVSFTNGQAGTPERVTGGLNFPLGVTLCDTSKRVCPEPATQATPAIQPTAGAPG